MTSENFPARPGPARSREIVLLDLGADVAAADALREAARRGLERPTYDDALHFGIAHPEVQRVRPVVFLHEPWVGHFGRRDVLCLWDNAGRRELGLDSFDERWTGTRFAFVRPPASA